MALAENSNCDGPNDVCCHEDDILYFYPEDKMCSAIDGYKYVLRKVTYFYSWSSKYIPKALKEEDFFSYFPIVFLSSLLSGEFSAIQAQREVVKIKNLDFSLYLCALHVIFNA